MMRSNGAPTGGLSHTQARFFQDQGYFRLLDVFDEHEVTRLRTFVLTERAREDARRSGPGQGSSAKMFGLYQRDPRLIGAVIRHPQLVRALWSLLGPDVVFVTNRHNHATVNDAAATKGEARLHRDILQPTRGLLTAVLYLEASTPENGCTHILPGSHTLPYVGAPQLDGGGTWMDQHQEYDGLEQQAVPVPMPAGGVLLVNGLVFHRVGVNTGGGTRISMTLGFRAIDEIDVAPDGARQIVVAGSQRYLGNDGARGAARCSEQPSGLT